MDEKMNNDGRYDSPPSYLYGWICISFSITPFFSWLDTKNPIILLVFLVFFLGGAVFLLIGRHQSKMALKKDGAGAVKR